MTDPPRLRLGLDDRNPPVSASVVVRRLHGSDDPAWRFMADTRTEAIDRITAHMKANPTHMEWEIWMTER